MFLLSLLSSFPVRLKNGRLVVAVGANGAFPELGDEGSGLGASFEDSEGSLGALDGRGRSNPSLVGVSLRLGAVDG